MSQNSSPSLLDSSQIVKRVYEESDDAVRVKVASGTNFQIALDASEDSVQVQGVSYSAKASITSANTGVIIPAFSCVGLKSANLYTNTTSTVTGAQACTLEISPSDSDNVWFTTAITVTESGTSGVKVTGAPGSLIARRARVSIAAAISGGTFDIYVVAQGN